MNPIRISRRRTILFILLCLLLQYCQAQINTVSNNTGTAAPIAQPVTRINFYVFTKDADSKVDFFGGTAVLRARTRSIASGKKLQVIIATDTRQVVQQMITALEGTNARVGSIWIDSHGLYKQGYSSFHIGSDEYSYKNINDSAYTQTLSLLATYCDAGTQIGIGSCYGGATFYFPGTATVPYGRMNGDSLMIGMGRIFTSSIIYGSESWVMAKPGIFNDKFGFAGYPLGKRYRTAYWQPVWERLGSWNRYSHSTGTFEPINTVALNRRGDIMVRLRNYQDLAKGQKAVERNMEKLSGR